MLGALLNGGASDANMERLVICSHEMVDCSDKVDITTNSDKTFHVQMNPKEVKYEFGVRDAKKESDSDTSKGIQGATGMSAPPTGFDGYSETNMVFNFQADATGIIPIPDKIKGEFSKGGKPSIRPHLEKLQDVVYAYKAESHGPPYLSLTWGKVFPASNTGETSSAVFKATLEKCEVKILLFSLSGEPVRADITLTLKSLVAPDARPLGNSPDITHNVDIQYGAKMTTICKGIYGRYDSKICAAIADYNGLVNCDLQTHAGKKLVFPSIHLLDDEYLEEWDKLEKDQKKAEKGKVKTHYERKVELIGQKRADQYFKTMELDKDEPYEEWRARRNRNKGYEA